MALEVVAEARVHLGKPARRGAPELELAHLVELAALHPLDEEPVALGRRVDHRPVMARRPERRLRKHGLVDGRLAPRVVEETRLGQPRLLVEAVPVQLLEGDPQPGPIRQLDVAAPRGGSSSGIRRGGGRSRAEARARRRRETRSSASRTASSVGAEAASLIATA